MPFHTKLEMPNLSPTMEKGNLKTWNVKVGDKIVPGDVLASIETDKATIDYEMQEEGYIAKLMYAEGTKDIPLGECMAVMVDELSDIPAFANYENGAAETAEPAQPVAAQAAPV